MKVVERFLYTALACTLVASPAAASLDVAFGANVPVGEDGRLFLSISSRYFERDVRVVEDWLQRFPTPDDLAVAMFLAPRCNQDVDWFVSLRNQRIGWVEIGRRCHVQPDIWFLPVAADPGPPYGKAYGYWKKHKQNPKTALVLSDGDVRSLMTVRMIHEYYGVPVETAMKMRSTGLDVRTLMAREYRGRHGRGSNKGGNALASNSDTSDSAKAEEGRFSETQGNKKKKH